MADNFNLYAQFAENFASRLDKPLVCPDSESVLTYGDIAARSAAIARCLSQLGVSPGDRVSVQVQKSPEALCLYLACLRAGFVFHPMNTAYKAGELDYFIRNAEPAVIVCDPDNETTLGDIAANAGTRNLLTLDSQGLGSLADAADSSTADFGTRPQQAGDLAALLYSSGTTGVPKGIMLTHANLLENTRALVNAWEFTADDRLLHALPIFHVHGLFVAIGCVMLSGASMRWLGAYDPATVVRYLPECTVMMGVPTYYTRLLQQEALNTRSAANIRVFVSGSAPLLEETFHEFEARTGHRILERYGMTETNMNTSNPLDGVRKPGTVGPPLPGVEARVVDDGGRELGVDEIGNLQVRGPNVFKGYWRMPEKTADDFTADGFFNTGDKGRIDTDGYVSIVGRAKDMVITGGLNVYPKEIELLIDDLAGVRESAIIGVPHADFGEAVLAVVVRDGEADTDIREEHIVDACKSVLANYKVPKRVEFVDELPRNSMAKVQKSLLRETYRNALAAD
ncbi:MAG: malonyl-CoA synthase [Pseudomonadota bacterium]